MVDVGSLPAAAFRRGWTNLKLADQHSELAEVVWFEAKVPLPEGGEAEKVVVLADENCGVGVTSKLVLPGSDPPQQVTHKVIFLPRSHRSRIYAVDGRHFRPSRPSTTLTQLLTPEILSKIKLTTFWADLAVGDSDAEERTVEASPGLDAAEVSKIVESAVADRVSQLDSKLDRMLSMMPSGDVAWASSPTGEDAREPEWMAGPRGPRAAARPVDLTVDGPPREPRPRADGRYPDPRASPNTFALPSFGMPDQSSSHPFAPAPRDAGANGRERGPQAGSIGPSMRGVHFGGPESNPAQPMTSEEIDQLRSLLRSDGERRDTLDTEFERYTAAQSGAQAYPPVAGVDSSQVAMLAAMSQLMQSMHGGAGDKPGAGIAGLEARDALRRADEQQPINGYLAGIEAARRVIRDKPTHFDLMREYMTRHVPMLDARERCHYTTLFLEMHRELEALLGSERVTTSEVGGLLGLVMKGYVFAAQTTIDSTIGDQPLLDHAWDLTLLPEVCPADWKHAADARWSRPVHLTPLAGRRHANVAMAAEGNLVSYKDKHTTGMGAEKKRLEAYERVRKAR